MCALRDIVAAASRRTASPTDAAAAADFEVQQQLKTRSIDRSQMQAHSGGQESSGSSSSSPRAPRRRKAVEPQEAAGSSANAGDAEIASTRKRTRAKPVAKEAEAVAPAAEASVDAASAGGMEASSWRQRQQQRRVAMAAKASGQTPEATAGAALNGSNGQSSGGRDSSGSSSRAKLVTAAAMREAAERQRGYYRMRSYLFRLRRRAVRAALLQAADIDLPRPGAYEGDVPKPYAKTAVQRQREKQRRVEAQRLLDGAAAAAAAASTSVGDSVPGGGQQPSGGRRHRLGPGFKRAAPSTYAWQLRQLQQQQQRAAPAGTAAAANGSARKGAGAQRPSESADKRASGESENVTADDESDDNGDDGGRGEAGAVYDARVERISAAVRPLLGRPLPEKAFYGRRAEQLAALGPDGAGRQCASWVATCGADFAAAFLCKEPGLLCSPPSVLLISLEALSQVFGLPPDECVAYLLKNHPLVGVTPAGLRDTVDSLCAVLRLPADDVTRILQRNPRLAMLGRDAVEEKLRQLNVALPVERNRLSALLQKRPLLLARSAASVARVIEALAGMLRLPMYDVAVMICSYPGLLGVAPDKLARRWARLQQLSGQHPAWRQQLDELRSGELPKLARCLATPDSYIERLQTLLQRGLQSMPWAFRINRVLTMSASQFDTWMSSPEAAAEEAAAMAAAAEAAASRGPSPSSLSSRLPASTNNLNGVGSNLRKPGASSMPVSSNPRVGRP